jgi:cell division protein FtsW
VVGGGSLAQVADLCMVRIGSAGTVFSLLSRGAGGAGEWIALCADSAALGFCGPDVVQLDCPYLAGSAAEGIGHSGPGSAGTGGVDLIPAVGVTVNGATRWLPLGPFMIQPSELMKPCLVLQGARLFGRWHYLSWRTRLTWLGIFMAILAAILLQPNLSTAAICGLTLWLIALASGIPYSYMAMTAIGGLSAAFVSISINTYQRHRIIAFLNPWADAGGSGYQLIQSLLAIGSGGLLGQGYGLSQQKLDYLPIQYTDFIFAVYAEEFGFIGGMVLLLLLAIYASLALFVAMRVTQPLHKLVAVGSMVLLVGQALLNMGVATGVLPTTGLPFPLLSYGGSSMLASLATAALLVRAAREINLDEPVPLIGKRRRSFLRLITGSSAQARS